jgi:uncharacterized protein (TIGR02594 family)
MPDMPAIHEPTVKDIQLRLQARGYDPGPADGIRGRLTIAGLERFQRAMHLPVTGLADDATMALLWGGDFRPEGSPDATPWLDYAYRAKGLREKADNARLKEFLKSDGRTVGDPAKVPWCGDFVQTCIAMTLPREPLPANPYGAINWLPFGREVSPRRGAILVFWRGTPASWAGHVGFYIGEDQSYFHVLGGNQSDMVSETKIAKTRLRPHGCRWPRTALEHDSGAIVQDGAHLVETTNEQ